MRSPILNGRSKKKNSEKVYNMVKIDKQERKKREQAKMNKALDGLRDNLNAYDMLPESYVLNKYEIEALKQVLNG